MWIFFVSFLKNENMAASLIILLTISFKVCYAESHCGYTELCELKNIRGISQTPSLILIASMYPASCPGFCSQRAVAPFTNMV